MSPRLKLAFLASRNGSAFRAAVEAVGQGRLAADIVLLGTNTAKAPALDFARARGIPHRVIPTAVDPEAADRELAEALAASGADWIVLSGYLRRIGPAVLARFPDRILNIHPGPLPAFGGEGMYGRRVHEAVIAAGAPQSEVTIHLVDGEYDHGRVLGRWPVPVEPGDTPETLEQRVTALEPEVMTRTLIELAEGRLRIDQAS
ncbi:phosphoribosylglycinamide formyltransferase [Phenylobacterium sp.]|uniref:phosphoribosylglycinamide formyltransferase n=1 Tax=Phenylobacterium sp. TaxID=1871053 RepID=UPI0025FD7AD5|nr:phosphoribosylglycinamide formyltransferase [Phenylobacterium sp.]MCA3713924.1 phosphoribosylglycinamide formyltransferase [Phenylobacterium sp.]MCA3739549.1 phosphoribosylglycinamide formyltransferase [Phenylobacterium sp.]